MVDDASAEPTPSARRRRAGARYIRRETRGGAGAARNDGLDGREPRARRAARLRLRPAPGLAGRRCSPHFADPSWTRRAADRGARMARTALIRRATRRAHSPLDRGPDARARDPVRARAVRARRGARRPPAPAFRRDAARAARTSSSCWRAPYVRYEPASHGRARAPDRAARVARPPRLLRPDRGAAGQAPPRQRAAAARLALDDRRVGRARRQAPEDGARDHRRRDRAARPRARTPNDRGRARRPRHAALRPRRRRRARPPLVAAVGRSRRQVPRRVLAARGGAPPAPAQARRRPRVRRPASGRLRAAPHARSAAARQAAGGSTPYCAPWAPSHGSRRAPSNGS